MYEVWRVSGVSKPNLMERHDDFNSAMKALIENSEYHADIEWAEPENGTLAIRFKRGGFKYWIQRKSD